MQKFNDDIQHAQVQWWYTPCRSSMMIYTMQKFNDDIQHAEVQW